MSHRAMLARQRKVRRARARLEDAIRERDEAVCEVVAEGASLAEVGRRLGITPQGVKRIIVRRSA